MFKTNIPRIKVDLWIHLVALWWSHMRTDIWFSMEPMIHHQRESYCVITLPSIEFTFERLQKDWWEQINFWSFFSRQNLACLTTKYGFWMKVITFVTTQWLKRQLIRWLLKLLIHGAMMCMERPPTVTWESTAFDPLLWTVRCLSYSLQCTNIRSFMYSA